LGQETTKRVGLAAIITSAGPLSEISGRDGRDKWTRKKEGRQFKIDHRFKKETIQSCRG